MRIQTQVAPDFCFSFPFAFDLLPMTIRLLSSITGALLLLLSLSIDTVQAQDWRQEVQLVAPVEYDGPLQVLTDSLSALFARNPGVLVRREAQDSTLIPARQLRKQLHEDGVDISSATHAFIRYKFELGRSYKIVETITDIYFIYRRSSSQTDIPILYLTTKEPAISELIRKRGIPSRMNLEATTPFRDLLAFPNLKNHQETAVVEFARRPLRGYTTTPEQLAFEEFLRERISQGGGSYVLALPEPVAADIASVDTPVNVTVRSEE
jgi:hypothetical protein